MQALIQHFIRENGAWTCIAPTEFDGPKGRVRVSIASRFVRGTDFMGVDLAKCLDEEREKAKTIRPVDPVLEKLKSLHQRAVEVQQAAYLVAQEAGRRETVTRRQLYTYVRERGFCPLCELQLTHCKGHGELDPAQLV